MEAPILLTKSQAEETIVARLRSRLAIEDVSIADVDGVERGFGWVFRVTTQSADSKSAATNAIPRLVIVNKYSAQVVASRIEYEPEQFIKHYERLLSKNQRRSDSWCSTAAFPLPWPFPRRKSVAEAAQELGFYEIRAEEKEHE